MQRLLFWLKTYFIPHEENDHRPHILRLEAVLFIVSFVLFLELVFLFEVLYIFPRTNFFATILPNVLVDLTNTNRLTNGLSVLKINPLLEEAARLKAEDMVEKGYFAHTSSEGVTPWDWMGKAGYQFSYAGENLAVNFFDSQDVVTAWMDSLSHRLNILNGNFTEVGIATARGVFQGRESVFVVQMFGRPVLAQAEIRPSEGAKAKPTPSSLVFDEMLVKVAGEVEVAPSPQPESILGYAAFGTKAISMPRAISRALFLALIGLVALALILNIFIKIEIQHPPLIINGTIILLTLISVLLINQYLIFSQAKIL